MEQYISGIQQVGIGTEDAEAYFQWSKNVFGFDVRLFDDKAEAALMTKYTGGEVHSRRAILSLNLNGGGGLEIWQFTSRNTVAPKEIIKLGDLGINAIKIKANHVKEIYQRCSAIQACSSLFEDDHGRLSFTLIDKHGNLFQVVEDKVWFRKRKYMQGGVAGAVIGVKDMEKAILFYTKGLGFSEIISDKTDAAQDLAINQTGKQYRRVLLKYRNKFNGAFSKLLGDAEIELVQVQDGYPVKIFENRYWGDAGFIHLCFDVINMEGLKKHLASLGYITVVDSADTFDMGESGGRFAYVEDPDGTLIELVETHKVPISKKLNWFLHLKKRKVQKPLPDILIHLMGVGK